MPLLLGPFFTQAHKALLYFVSFDKGKINTRVTFVQHTAHSSNEAFFKDPFREKVIALDVLSLTFQSGAFLKEALFSLSL